MRSGRDILPRARCVGLGLAFVLSLGTALGVSTVAAQQSGPIAIVVHPSTRVNNLSFADLRQIFLGERQFWPDNSRVTLLVRAPVAYERRLVLDRIYRMSEGQFRQYWIAKLFRAEVASGPKIVYSTDMTHHLVTALPGAIGFMPASAVSGNVKVLRIDGKRPGEPGYPLQ